MHWITEPIAATLVFRGNVPIKGGLDNTEFSTKIANIGFVFAHRRHGKSKLGRRHLWFANIYLINHIPEMPLLLTFENRWCC